MSLLEPGVVTGGSMGIDKPLPLAIQSILAGEFSRLARNHNLPCDDNVG